jgi:hypothetical protein
MAELPLPSLDGVRMRVVATAANGVGGADTLFVFKQQGGVVTSAYAGGRIAAGFLAGKWEHGRLFFRYVQITTDEQVESGRSEAKLTRSAGGRLRLEEHFQWESKPGSGTNVFEEI